MLGLKLNHASKRGPRYAIAEYGHKYVICYNSRICYHGNPTGIDKMLIQYGLGTGEFITVN